QAVAELLAGLAELGRVLLQVFAHRRERGGHHPPSSAEAATFASEPASAGAPASTALAWSASRRIGSDIIRCRPKPRNDATSTLPKTTMRIAACRPAMSPCCTFTTATAFSAPGRTPTDVYRPRRRPASGKLSSFGAGS